MGLLLCITWQGICRAQDEAVTGFATIPQSFRFEEAEPFPLEAEPDRGAPADMSPSGGGAPWWNEQVSVPLSSPENALQLSLNDLMLWTIQYSGRLQAVSQTIEIAESQLVQAQGAFDPQLFSDNRFNSTSDPVESTLVTGGPPRLEDQVLGIDAGLRGQSERGTNYTFGQRLGIKDSNSTFFSPANQGTSRLRANVTHPLMRGRRTDSNRTFVLTARLEGEVAKAQYGKSLQKQLSQVADTYWSLFAERAALLQRERHLKRAEDILQMISNRRNHDASMNEVLRAQAAVTNRQAELLRVGTTIKNLESQLRALVNAPELTDYRERELLPMDQASLTSSEYSIENAVGVALTQRPEISEINIQMHAVRAKLDLARDQTRPVLNLVAEGYLAGLQADADVGAAWVDQFSTGRPGYTGGLVYERPIQNRVARGTLKQRQLEMIQLEHLLRESNENIRAEVESAVRLVAVSRLAALGRQASLAAVEAEVSYLFDRWQTLGNDPRLGQIQLNELLLAQDRLLQEEQLLLQALVDFNRSEIELQRATGSLIVVRHDQ